MSISNATWIQITDLQIVSYIHESEYLQSACTSWCCTTQNHTITDCDASRSVKLPLALLHTFGSQSFSKQNTQVEFLPDVSACISTTCTIIYHLLQYLELRFNRTIRLLGTVLFIIQTVGETLCCGARLQSNKGPVEAIAACLCADPVHRDRHLRPSAGLESGYVNLFLVFIHINQCSVMRSIKRNQETDCF